MTSKIKELADIRTQSMDDVDTVLRVCAFLLPCRVYIRFLFCCRTNAAFSDDRPSRYRCGYTQGPTKGGVQRDAFRPQVR